MITLNKTILIISLLAFAQVTRAQNKFEPTWESLAQYECPEWFQDAKFGIYAHWGVFSTAKCPGSPDWYGHNMYVEGHPNNTFHLENFGSLDKFGYKDLVPLFTAAKFDADEWADLFVEAGARFAGPVGEHADGFAMWDSKVNPWNSVNKGPKRDVVAELEKFGTVDSASTSPIPHCHQRSHETACLHIAP